MSLSKVAGIIFTNVQDELVPQLTSHRSMASVPFGGRYRLIDFPLSNLVNAGVSNVGLVIRDKYRSLLDHVGSGIYWDLDRKNGGLHLMPPFNTRLAKRYTSNAEALYGAMDFVKRCNADYIIGYNANSIANVDITALIKAHKKSEADITVVYANGARPAHHNDAVELFVDENGRITGHNGGASQGAVNYSIGIMICSRELLVKIVDEAYNDETPFEEIIEGKKVYGFKHEGFCAVLDSESAYYEANMDLLNDDIRHDLFNKERPILTKTRDEMPTRYGTKAQVENCFIADGCVIEGTVKNSILFRGVKVEKGAVVENCILMQGTVVSADVQLDRVISDKNAVVGEGMIIKGTNKKTFLIKKNQSL